jgi:diguanylate cyclase (GGDEF)-like protein/PAS domain S-box-containing protein
VSGWLRWWRRRWSARARRVVAVVLVFNIALGMAFSIIGLRRQGDARSRAEAQVAAHAAAATALRAEVWRSVAQGAATAKLAATDLHTVRSWGGGRAGGPAAEFAAAVASVRSALSAGDRRAAERDAVVTDTTSAALHERLDQIAAARLRSVHDAGRTADIETVVLMLFAAAMGLLLFRRTVAARVHGDLQAARERERAEARFASLVRHSSDVISIVDVGFTVAYQSPSARTVLGYADGELSGRVLLDLVHPDDRVQLLAAHAGLMNGADSMSTTVRVRAADNKWRHVESVHTDMRHDDSVAGIVITSRDVSERVALTEQLRHSALHDELTGLANRVLFTDRVEHALSKRADTGAPPAVVFLDLDDFKTVNDTMGHQAGDELLVEIGRRLSGAIRATDTVARFGGDEFAILIEGVDLATCTTMLQRLQDALRLPFQLRGRELTMHASLGLARGDLAADAGSLLAHADLAMYEAKASGKDTMLEFTPDMGEHALARLQIETELQRALHEDQIRAYFQPTIDLVSGRISGFEALARWEHPTRGTLAPVEFIPVAEHTGQIVQIGRTVLRQACHALASWHRAHPELSELTVAVNLSARELLEPDLVTVVSGALQESGLAADRLTLEVTESLLVTDPEQARSKLTTLRRLGVQIAIDDFGTGYSSLSYLENLPVDIVKIDKSFVDRLATGQPNVIVETIAQLGTALGLRTVAEGVEHQSQADLLRGLGCDLGQGYLYSRPVAPDQIDGLLVSLQGTGSIQPERADVPRIA